ncbi:MAG: HAD hydrolase-like protein [Lysobacterales bacterium]
MLWEWENGGRRVYILDLDGTLIPTAEIDNNCFWQAVFACFEKRKRMPELHGFKHVTDSGILDEWCIRELGRSPAMDETLQIKQRFGQLLESAFAEAPAHFSPLPGVADWLGAIRENRHVFAGIATGGWEHSARLKLRLSGLDRFGLPMASSDDAVSRTEIMQIAARRTLGRQTINDAVFTYVGDGAWDLKASRELNWDFIGIATGPRATHLRRAGAALVQGDFCKS